MWGSILAFVAKYGTPAVRWAWQNKSWLISLGSAAYEIIRSIWG